MEIFEVPVFDKKNKKFIECEFICKKSKSNHNKLKNFANGRTYWFEGLTGANWHRGGFYSLNGGFINPSLTIENNVQGVVFDNDVYLLREVRIKK